VYVDEAGSTALIQDVRTQALELADMKDERDALLEFQVEASAEVVENSRSIAAAERRLSVMLSSLLDRVVTLEADYNELSGGLTAERLDRLRQIEVQAQLDILENTVETLQDEVGELRVQLQDAQIQQQQGTGGEVTIVEEARSATVSTGPDQLYKALVGALVGLLMGGLLAFLLESMDTSIGTIEDVESFIGSPVVGVIPHLDVDDIEGDLRRGAPADSADEDYA